MPPNLPRRPDQPRRPTPSPREDIESFLRAAGPPPARRGRLLFALDATMSRQPTWDMACSVQADMFDAAAAVGGLSVRLAYFRGIDEARASRWVDDPAALAGLMTRIACAGGRTQIGRMLTLAERDATAPGGLGALVYVGDCMEEEAGALIDKAARLALHGVPAFMFHEGRDPVAARTFREIAAVSGGVYRRFDSAAAASLRALLEAAAIYAVGGRPALEAHGGPAARAMLADLR